MVDNLVIVYDIFSAKNGRVSELLHIVPLSFQPHEQSASRSAEEVGGFEHSKGLGNHQLILSTAVSANGGVVSYSWHATGPRANQLTYRASLNNGAEFSGGYVNVSSALPD